MKRLTKINGKYIEYSDENYNNSIDNRTMLEKCLRKLAEYEDLEEQGLLLQLPCKVGSPLYRVYKKPTKCTAYGEYKDDYACQGCEKECDSSYIWALYKYKADIKTIVYLSDEIGKTVFLTRAKAEQKLKEMNTNNGITEQKEKSKEQLSF